MQLTPRARLSGGSPYVLRVQCSVFAGKHTIFNKLDRRYNIYSVTIQTNRLAFVEDTLSRYNTIREQLQMTHVVRIQQVQCARANAAPETHESFRGH